MGVTEKRSATLIITYWNLFVNSTKYRCVLLQQCSLCITFWLLSDQTETSRRTSTTIEVKYSYQQLFTHKERYVNYADSSCYGATLDSRSIPLYTGMLIIKFCQSSINIVVPLRLF